MSTEEQKAKHRDFYYKHHERYKASAKERAAKKRAEHKETPEEAEARRAYHRAYYAAKTGPAFKSERAANKEDLAALVPTTEPARTQFNWLMIGLLAAKQKAQDDYRRDWKRKRYGYKARAPKAPKPNKEPKPPRIPLTREQRNKLQNAKLRELRKDPEWLAKRNAYKRAHQRAQLEKAKSDPQALIALRAKRNSASKKWLNKLRTEQPDRYKEWLKHESEYEKNIRRTNPQRRISTILRTKMYVAIRRQQSGQKSFNTIELTGCTVPELIKHIEGQFQPGMTWGNFGRGIGKWSLDHVRPCASYDLTDPEQQKLAFHFSNIQPMWFVENCAKSSHWNNKKWSHSEHACQPPPPVQGTSVL